MQVVFIKSFVLCKCFVIKEQWRQKLSIVNDFIKIFERIEQILLCKTCVL